MKPLAISAVSFAFAILFASASAAVDREAFLKRCEEERPRIVARLETLLRQLTADRAAIARRPYQRKQAKAAAIKERDRQIGELKKRIAGLKDRTILSPPTIKGAEPVDEISARAGRPEDHFEVGDAGRWEYDEVHVDQVISKTEAICTNGVPFLLRGVDTTKMADGSVWPMAGLFEITGTFRYETVLGGSKQVVVVEPFVLAEPSATRQ